MKKINVKEKLLDLLVKSGGFNGKELARIAIVMGLKKLKTLKQGEFIREINGNEVELVEHYRELERRNEVVIKELPNKFVMRVFKAESRRRGR